MKRQHLFREVNKANQRWAEGKRKKMTGDKK